MDVCSMFMVRAGCSKFADPGFRRCKACRVGEHQRIKAWKLANWEKHLAGESRRKERYTKKHPDRVLALRTKSREKSKKNYHSDPEFRARILSVGKQWRDANPEKVLANVANRKAMKLGVPGRYTPADIEALRVKQGGLCFHCKRERKLTVDHVIPLSRPGSSNWPSNIVLACISCNCGRGNRLVSEWNKSA